MIEPTSIDDKVVAYTTLIATLKIAIVHEIIPARRHEMLAMLSRTQASLERIQKLAVETKRAY